MEKYGYSFSFGPWNIHEGADPFGPTVRPSVAFAEKLRLLKELGFDAMQFHDDDAVPNLDDKSAPEISREARAMRQLLADHGLTAEFVAPRLWEHPMTVDGGFTANDPVARAYANERARKAADIGRELGTNLMVLWLAREGTYLRESKDAVQATHRLLATLDMLLSHDPDLRIAIEPKPNEPMDLAYIPTIGHALALGMQSSDPGRVGALVESAHAVLAGLDQPGARAGRKPLLAEGYGRLGRQGYPYPAGRAGHQAPQQQPGHLPAPGRGGALPGPRPHRQPARGAGLRGVGLAGVECIDG